MKAKASITIAALLISTGVWAQSDPQYDSNPYGTGTKATDQGRPKSAQQDADKAKSRDNIITKKQNRSANGTDTSGSSGTSATTGSGNTTGTELRNDLTPLPPASKPAQDVPPMPRKTDPMPTPTPDFPPSKQY